MGKDSRKTDKDDAQAICLCVILFSLISILIFHAAGGGGNLFVPIQFAALFKRFAHYVERVPRERALDDGGFDLRVNVI